MKTRLLLLATLLAASCLAPAQTPPAPDAPAPANPGKKGKGERGHGGGPLHQWMKSLPADQRQRVESARATALKDPAVQSALQNRENDRRGFRQAMRAAMIKTDPGLDQILPQPGQFKGKGKNSGDGAQGQPSEERFARFLSQPERDQLKSAHEQTLAAHPELATERERVRALPDGPVKKQARQAFQQNMEQTLRRETPAVAPILDKLALARQKTPQD